MKKEWVIEDKNTLDFWRDTQRLRRLLHERWKLGEGGMLSLLPDEKGVSVVAVEDTSEGKAPLIDEVLHTVGIILREGLCKR